MLFARLQGFSQRSHERYLVNGRGFLINRLHEQQCRLNAKCQFISPKVERGSGDMLSFQRVLPSLCTHQKSHEVVLQSDVFHIHWQMRILAGAGLEPE